MKFYKYINEKSFGKEDIPKDFWVVFDLEEMKDQLKSRKVKGLKGVSSSSDIQFEFLGVARDAMLQMPSKDLLKDNNITRIMYNNPHYFVSKNMWALRRLYKATQTNWTDQVFGNLFRALQKHIKDKQLKHDMEYYGVSNVDWDWSKKASPSLKINSIKDLSKTIKSYIETVFSKKTKHTYNVNDSDLQKTLYDVLLEIGKIYSVENEWIIKDNYLTIPSTSTLYILTADFLNFNKKVFEKFKKHNIDTTHSMFDLISKIKEAGIESGDYDSKDTYAYQKKVKIEKMTDTLKDKYKIVELTIKEFKTKQLKYFERNK